MHPIILTISLAALLAPLAASPQALVLDLISPAGEPLEVTDDVRLQRFADFEEAPQVEIGMQLDDGDLLSAVSGRTQLELECPPDSNSTFKLSGPFRIIITNADDDCRLDLLSGGLDVLTDGDTEVNSGGAVLGTEGTQYAVRLYRREGSAIRDLSVFDGTVAVTGIEEPIRVGTLETLSMSPEFEKPVRGKPDERSLWRTSALYGRFDAGKAIRMGADKAKVRELQAQLRERHFKVLVRPDSKEARVELAQTQIAHKLNNEAVYNLRRADVVDQQGFDTYKIDVNQVSAGLRPSNYQFIQARFPSAKLRYVPATELQGNGGGNAAWLRSNVTSRSVQNINQADLKRAIEQLNRKVQAGTANSMDYYALSKAHIALGDAKTGETYAKRAMNMSQSDRMLSQDQLRQVNTMVKKPGN